MGQKVFNGLWLDMLFINHITMGDRIYIYEQLLFQYAAPFDREN